MKLSVFSFQDDCVSDSFNVSTKVFDVVFNVNLVQQVLHASICSTKIGTKAQKTRSEVRGGGVKPWKQKNTGRARAGTIRSPLWRGGGQIFAARSPQTKYVKRLKINKKMRKTALRCIFSEILRLGRLFVCEDINIKDGKTQSFLKILSKDFQVDGGIYILDNTQNIFLRQATLNLYNVYIGSTHCISIINLLKCKSIILTRGFLEEIERFLQCDV